MNAESAKAELVAILKAPNFFQTDDVRFEPVVFRECESGEVAFDWDNECEQCFVSPGGMAKNLPRDWSDLDAVVLAAQRRARRLAIERAGLYGILCAITVPAKREVERG